MTPVGAGLWGSYPTRDQEFQGNAFFLHKLEDDRAEKGTHKYKGLAMCMEYGVKDIIKPPRGSHSPGEADLESEIPGGFRHAFTERYPEEGVLNSA